MENKKYKYIVIEGAIGAGKTSLAKIAREKLEAKLILECFEDNPLLEKFYQDMAKYAFHTQIYFLISRYQQQIKEVQEFSLFHKHLIADYFFNKDKIFAYLNLTDYQLNIYEKIYKAFEPDIRKPDLILFLKAPVDVLYKRIKQRGRDYEQNISIDYLQNLSAAYAHYFKYYSFCPVYSIDIARYNWIDDENDREEIFKIIEDIMDDKKQFTELILENSSIFERNN